MTGRWDDGVYPIGHDLCPSFFQVPVIAMQTTPFVRPSDDDLLRARAELRDDIAARLRSVCAEWPAEEFERIVDRVTETTMKYAEPSSEASADSNSR